MSDHKALLSKTLTHFTTAHPASSSLLRSREYKPVFPTNRIPKESTEDAFFAETLASERTIKHMLLIYLNPPELRSKDANTREAFIRGVNKGDQPVQEAKLLLDIGEGIAGYPRLAHGGFTAAMLDETLGMLLNINMEIQKLGARKRVASSKSTSSSSSLPSSPKSDAIELSPSRTVRDEEVGAPAFLASGIKDAVGGTHMTAFLNIKYLAPVPTPGLVITTARIKSVSEDGRKVWMEGWLEDAEGTKCASCETMFVQPRKKPGLKL